VYTFDDRVAYDAASDGIVRCNGRHVRVFTVTILQDIVIPIPGGKDILIPEGPRHVGFELYRKGTPVNGTDVDYIRLGDDSADVTMGTIDTDRASFVITTKKDPVAYYVYSPSRMTPEP
jgi:hypothetical protein